MDVFKNLEALKDAAKRKKLCEIYYISSKGRRKRYELEPYEIRDGFLFAVHNGQTKQFNIHKIDLATVYEEKDWEEVKYARKIIGELELNDNTDTNQSS